MGPNGLVQLCVIGWVTKNTSGMFWKIQLEPFVIYNWFQLKFEIFFFAGIAFIAIQLFACAQSVAIVVLKIE